jgi:hypothetical protein
LFQVLVGRGGTRTGSENVVGVLAQINNTWDTLEHFAGKIHKL